jgi:hypothetical protein
MDFDPPVWRDGWLSGVRHLPSPNFGPRPAQAQVDLLVVHSISLPPGQFGTGCVQQLFTNQLDWDAHPYFQGIRGLECPRISSSSARPDLAVCRATTRLACRPVQLARARQLQ